MQSISRSLASYPLAAGTHRWANGVVHNDDQHDVYSLPTSTPGVAARIELKPTWWGLGREVVATDCEGNRLNARRGWSGLHRTVVSTDPRSGLETVFDPSEQTVSVTTPLVDLQKDGGGRRVCREYHRDARQELDADGTSRFVVGLHGESETYIAGGGREAVAVSLGESRTWSQVELAPGKDPVGYQMRETREGGLQRGDSLQAAVSDHDLSLTRDDGVTVSYELFLRSDLRGDGTG